MSSFVSDLMRCLSPARQAFHAKGFDLPLMYLQAVESVRSRGASERDYQYYLDEVLRESLAMRFPWQVSLRTELSPSQRSSYLDALSALWSSGAFRTSPSPHGILDPNFAAFVEVKGVEWSEALGRFREQKSHEASTHAEAYARATKKAAYGNASDLLTMLGEIVAEHGYETPRKFKVSDEAIEFRVKDMRGATAIARIVDLRSIVRRGSVMIQYVFDVAPHKPLGLDNFVPGGYLYSEWNRTVDAIAFSFYAQCLFLRILCQAFDEI